MKIKTRLHEKYDLKAYCLLILLGCNLEAVYYHHQMLERYDCKEIKFFVCNQVSLYKNISSCKRKGKWIDQYMIFMILRTVLNNSLLKKSYEESLSSYFDGYVYHCDIDSRENFIFESKK